MYRQVSSMIQRRKGHDRSFQKYHTHAGSTEGTNNSKFGSLGTCWVGSVAICECEGWAVMMDCNKQFAVRRQWGGQIREAFGG